MTQVSSFSTQVVNSNLPKTHREQRLDGIYSNLYPEDFRILEPLLDADGKTLTDHLPIFASYQLMELTARIYVGTHPVSYDSHLAWQN